MAINKTYWIANVRSNSGFYELEVLDGKAELREIARQMVEFNEEGEPETLVYNVYMSEDGKLFNFLETWANSSVEYFAERFATGKFVAQVLERTGAGRLCFYGNVSDDMKLGVENGFEVEYANRIDGFVR